MPYNLVWRPIEYEILPFCRQNGVGIMVYSPLMQGILTDRYATVDDVPDGIARSRHFSPDRPMSQHGDVGAEDELFEAVRAVRKIASDLGRSTAAVSLAWLRRETAVTTLLIGARNAGEVQMNLEAFDFDLSGRRCRRPFRSHRQRLRSTWAPTPTCGATPEECVKAIGCPGPRNVYQTPSLTTTRRGVSCGRPLGAVSGNSGNANSYTVWGFWTPCKAGTDSHPGPRPSP